MNGDPLLAQLRQLAEKLQEKNVPLVIGGGYGLLLKANHIQHVGARTRLEVIPIARSTADIDMRISSRKRGKRKRLPAFPSNESSARRLNAPCLLFESV